MKQSEAKVTSDATSQIYLDIETFSGEKPPLDDFEVPPKIVSAIAKAEESLLDVKADSRLKDPAKIEADITKKRDVLTELLPVLIQEGEGARLNLQDMAWRSQSLDPYKGEVFCIGVAVGDDTSTCLWAPDEHRTMILLEAFLEHHPMAHYYAHNGIDFDYYWLFVKGLKYKLPRVIRAFSNKYVLKDTMKAMDGAAWKKMTSLDKMAETLGFAGKGDITGADVHDMVLEGKGDQVCAYCESDVNILRNCAKELAKYGLV